MQHGQLLLASACVLTVATLYGAYRWYYIDDYGYGYFMTGFGYSLIAAAFGALVLAALSPSSWLHRVHVPGAAQIALWSYAIYLTHKPIGIIAQRELSASVGPATLAIIVIALSVLGGWLLFRLVETPFMELRDRAFPTMFEARLRYSAANA